MPMESSVRIPFWGVLCLLVVHACAGSGAGMPSTVLTSQPASAFSVDSFYIKPQGDFKYKYRGAYIQGNTVRQYFYNYSGSSMDYIDFGTREHVRLFNLDETLANSLEGIGILSPDTLVLLLNTGVALYTPKGDLLQEYAFTEQERKRVSWSGMYSPLLTAPFGYIYSRRQKDRSVLAAYRFAEQKASSVPITSPKLTEGDVGMLGQHAQAYFNNKVAVLFNVSSDVFVYDFKQKTTQAYSVKSEYDPGFKPFMGGDMREAQNHFTGTGHYYNITYDPYRDQLLLVYLHPQPLQNEAGYYNDPFMTRNASLIVVDAQFRHKQEYVFPASRYWLFFHPYPTQEGIVLKAAQAQEDYAQNGMKYFLLKFDE